jgi:hypothetical protein
MPDPRQKKLAKHKKKRAGAQRGRFSGARNDAAEAMLRTIRRDGPGYPAGPCFIASTWKDQSKSRVLPVAITRRPAAGHLAMVIFLVDLGCFGLKDAILTMPFEESNLDELLQNLANVAQEPIMGISLEDASTIIRRAVGWGRKLGVEPEAEDAQLLSWLAPDEPSELEVPLGRDGKVVYEPDPEEDTKPMVQKLVQAVGPDGFVVDLPRKKEVESKPEAQDET